MANVTVTNISYNFDILYAEGKAVEKILRDIDYEFEASNNEFKLNGKITFKTELSREEAEQKIRALME